jgi:hypothetical protein
MAYYDDDDNDDNDDHITVLDALDKVPENQMGGHDQWTDDQMGGNQLDLMEQQLMTLWDNARTQQMGGNCSANNHGNNTMQSMLGGNCGADNNFGPTQPMMGGNCSAMGATAPMSMQSMQSMMGGNCSAMSNAPMPPVGMSTSWGPIQPAGMSSSGHQVYQVTPSAMTTYGNMMGGYRTKGSKNHNPYTGSDRSRGSADSTGKPKRPAGEAFMAFQNLVAYMKQMDEFSSMKRRDVIHLAKKVMDTSKAQLGDDASVADRLALAKKLVKDNPAKYAH